MTSQSLLTSHPVLDLEQMHQTFQTSGIDTQLQDNQLTLENGTLATVITAVPVYGESLDSGPVAGLLRIRTEITQYLCESPASDPDPDQRMDRINRSAAMGAVYRDETGYTVGSRLTVRAGVRWEPSLLPLVFAAAVGAAPGMINAVQRIDRHQPPVDSAPGTWTVRDLEKAVSFLSRLSACTSDESGLTAQFSLASRAIIPVRSEDQAVRWQLRTDHTHPAIGGGLFASLELPSGIQDRAERVQLVRALNRREIDSVDGPPHFGAWTDGDTRDRIAYTTFLPNELREAPGIAVTLSFWALNRALWVSDVMRSTPGVRGGWSAGGGCGVGGATIYVRGSASE